MSFKLIYHPFEDNHEHLTTEVICLECDKLSIDKDRDRIDSVRWLYFQTESERYDISGTIKQTRMIDQKVLVTYVKVDDEVLFKNNVNKGPLL